MSFRINSRKYYPSSGFTQWSCYANYKLPKMLKGIVAICFFISFKYEIWLYHHISSFRLLSVKCRNHYSTLFRNVASKYSRIRPPVVSSATPKIKILSSSTLAAFVVTVNCSKKKVNIEIEKQYLAEVSAEESLDWIDVLRILNPDTWRLIIAILVGNYYYHDWIQSVT